MIPAAFVLHCAIKCTPTICDGFPGLDVGVASGANQRMNRNVVGMCSVALYIGCTMFSMNKYGKHYSREVVVSRYNECDNVSS